MPSRKSSNTSQSILEQKNVRNIRGRHSNSTAIPKTNNSELISHDIDHENNGEGLDLLDVETILKPTHTKARDSTVKKFIRRDYAQDKGMLISLDIFENCITIFFERYET